MKISATIARVLLGLAFLVFGLNGFLQFIKAPPPPPGPAGDFTKALIVSHYFQAVAVFQIAGGVLLLVGKFVPLGLLLLGPVIVNILFFHIFLYSTGLGMAIVTALLALIVLFHHRAAFAAFLKP